MPAITNTTETPAMIPPKGELAPSTWEAYGWLGTLAILIIAVVLVFMARKRVPTAPPSCSPETTVRQRLAQLPRRPATPEDALEISRVLRDYLNALFYIPSGALTTEELLPVLHRQHDLSLELVANTQVILILCDQIAFGAPPYGDQSKLLVEKASELAERFILVQRTREQTSTSTTVGRVN